MDKRKILIQLDSDPQPSVFDRVVAIDAGADEVFSYGGVKPEQVRDLVHGAIFTRGPKDLKSTAIFIGGSDVAAVERLLVEVEQSLLPQFGLSVSVLLDSQGANTTSAAAVRVASRHMELKGVSALVLGGTGPVGQLVSRLLVCQGAKVWIGSRQFSRAEDICWKIGLHLVHRPPKTIEARVSMTVPEPVATGTPAELENALKGRTLIISAGAAGAVLLPRSARTAYPELKMLIDLNAVPPLGIEGVEVADKGTQRDGIICYGAIGVGETKMKIHKAAIAKLFESNDQIMDAEEVYELASTI